MTEHPGSFLSQDNSPPMDHILKHTHTHTHTQGWIHVTMRRLSLSPPFSLTHGLQHFLPARHEILKPSPTVSHGDLLQEVSHSSVILPLLFHPSASRVIHSPVSILRIKVEAHSSIQAKVPGSTVCLSSSQRHVILACRVRGSAPTMGKKELSLWA